MVEKWEKEIVDFGKLGNNEKWELWKREIWNLWNWKVGLDFFKKILYNIKHTNKKEELK